MAQLAAVVGYAVVVAFTMLPVLTVIAVLLDTGQPERGWQLTAGYAAGLIALFVLASFGLASSLCRGSVTPVGSRSWPGCCWWRPPSPWATGTRIGRPPRGIAPNR